MEVLKPRYTRTKGFIVCSSIVIAFGLLSLIGQNQYPILSKVFFLFGLILGCLVFFQNLVTVPVGTRAVKYFWNEPQNGSVLGEGTHWILPFFEKLTWDDITIQTQDFTLGNVRATNNEPLSFNVFVQFSISNVHVALYINPEDRIRKMQQILIDTLNVEIQRNNLTDTGIIANTARLNTVMRSNLAAHMELRWGCEVVSVAIMGITHLNLLRQGDIYDKNSFQLQLNRVSQIVRELGYSPEEAFRLDLIRTGKIRQNQNVNIYEFPDAARIIQAVASILNRR